MNHEQLEEQVLTNSRDITALMESTKSAHKRIDRNDALVTQLHKLATSVETLAFQLKVQGDRLEEMIKSQQEQGKRIGELETKPAKKWDMATSQITALLIAAVVGAVISRLF